MNDFNPISNFLEKFKIKFFQKEEIYRIIIDVIFKKINFSIKQDSIKIKNSLIYINCSPLVKNELLINKEKILAELKERIKDSNFTDIK